MDNEYTTVGTQTYVNPQTAVDETNTFIDNFRNTQNNANAEIEQQTRALGSDLPASHGGLAGSEATWVNQYQTPYANAMVEGLRTTAQSDALNTAMSNYQAYLRDQYNQAYRNYAAREKAKSNSNSNNNSNNNSGGVDEESSDKEVTAAQEGLSQRKVQNLINQYVSEGMSLKDAFLKANENWASTYQSGNKYVNY